MSSRVARRWSALAVVPLTSVAACGGSTPAAAPVVPVTEVHAVATQTRPDQAAGGRLEITLTNTGGLAFTVTSVQLDSPGFAVEAPAVRDEPFVAGDTYDMPAPYGTARCDAEPLPATAVVELHRDGGPSGVVRLPLDSSDGLLTRIHDQECAAQDLARQVRVELSDVADGGPGLLTGVVHVVRGTATAAVTVTEIRPSVLYGIAAALPVTLAAGAVQLDLPVRITTATCAAHRIAETKQPYLFPLYVSLAGAPVRYVEIPTSAVQRAQLDALTRTACVGRTE